MTRLRPWLPKAVKNTNILKNLAGASWGVHPKHYVLFICLVRSRIDYASFIYDSAAKTQILKQDGVQNIALRVVGGFIKTTPIRAMECELCLPPLSSQRIFCYEVLSQGSSLVKQHYH